MIEIGPKLKSIREQLGLTQTRAAQMANFSASYIAHIESGRRAISEETLQHLKRAWAIEDVPVSMAEVDDFKVELRRWESHLLSYNTPEVFCRYEGLKKSALIAQDKSVFNEFLQVELTYFWTNSLWQEYESNFKSLYENKDRFNAVQQDELLFHLGYLAFNAGDFPNAYVYLAKSIQNPLAIHYFPHSTIAFVHYLIGYCYTELDYCGLALASLEKSEDLYLRNNDTSMLNYINGIRAVNKAKQGVFNSAVNQMEQCLFQEKISNGPVIYIAKIYTKLGEVYLLKGDGAKALAYFLEAESFIQKYQGTNEHSPPKEKRFGKQFYSLFIYENQYLKTLALKELDLIPEAEKELAAGLSACKKEQAWYYLFQALKHTQSLHLPESVDYLEETVIPQLKHFGRHGDLIHYCRILADHFESIFQRKKALKYANLALDTAVKISRGK